MLFSGLCVNRNLFCTSRQDEGKVNIGCKKVNKINKFYLGILHTVLILMDSFVDCFVVFFVFFKKETLHSVSILPT